MINDGCNGLLVEEKDSQGIAISILNLEKDKELYNKICEGARQDVIDYYSYLVGAKRYMDEIKDVIENKH